MTAFRRRTRLARRPDCRWRPSVLALEDRTVPSTVSSITANFNGTAIPVGESLWFNSALTASGLPKAAPATVHVVNGSIDFSAGGTNYHLAVPDADIVFTPGATAATTSYDTADGGWDVSVPTSGTGDVFMGGVEMPVANALPGGVKNVTWSASFWSDTSGVTVNWKWAAAAYKAFGNDYNGMGVKPVDANKLSAYQNSDQSGTPEAFKGSVVAGAMGNGGNNYTGNSSPSSMSPASGLASAPSSSSAASGWIAVPGLRFQSGQARRRTPPVGLLVCLSWRHAAPPGP